MRERRETLSFLSCLPRRERPLLAGKCKHRNSSLNGCHLNESFTLKIPLKDSKGCKNSYRDESEK